MSASPSSSSHSHTRQATEGRILGRAAELAALGALLCDDTVDHITIHGPFGIGRSTVAAEAIRQYGDRFGRILPARPGMWGLPRTTRLSVPRHTHRTADGSAAPATGATTGVGRILILRGEDTGPSDSQPLGSSDQDLHATTLTCALRPLGIDGERTVAIGMLPVSPEGAPVEVHRANPAVTLFRRRSAHAHPRQPIPDSELETVAAICRHLDGWPLAIVLAAEHLPYVPLPTLEQLVADEQERLLVLSSPDPHRPMNMNTALEWMWQRLPPDARAVWGAAGLFADRFTLQQAAHVADLPASRAADALSLLASLHLVHTAPAPGTQAYRLVHLARSFTSSHAVGGPQSTPRPGSTAIERFLEMTVDIARTALATAMAGNDDDAVRLAGSYTRELESTLSHLLRHERLQDALTVTAVLALAGGRRGRFEPLLSQLGPLLARHDLPPGAPLAAAFIGYADMLLRHLDNQDRRDHAIAVWRRGMTLTRRYGGPGSLLRALAVMVQAYPVTHDVALTRACTQEGITLARDGGHVRWLARFEAWSGMLAHQVGDLDSAQTLAISALARGRRAGDDRSRLLAGLLLRTLPEPPRGIPGGIPSLEVLLELAHRLGDIRMESTVSTAIAAAALRKGQLALAAQSLDAVLDLVHDEDAWIGGGIAIIFIALLLYARGEPIAAAQVHGMIANRLPVLLEQLPPHAAAMYRGALAQLEQELGSDDFHTHVRLVIARPWTDNLAAARQLLRVDPRAGNPPTTRTGWADLSPRQQQTLQLIAQGLDNKTIARRLGISISAVWHHTSRIFAKLGVENRAQAAIWAVRHLDDVDP